MKGGHGAVCAICKKEIVATQAAALYRDHALTHMKCLPSRPKRKKWTDNE